MTGKQRLLVVVNPAAGSTDANSVAAALTELRRGAEVTLVETSHRAELADAVKAREGRRLVVLGGDGSVHAAVRALDDTGTLDPDEPIGLIPCGTGNDLARALDLPLDPVDGAAAVLEGRARGLDLLRDDAGGVVVNAVHVGLGARAYAEATRFKSWLRTFSFPVGAVVAGVRSRSWRLRIEVDGRAVGVGSGDRDSRVLMVAVCNGSTIGGGTPLAPEARLDDGQADVLICTATGLLARAGFGLALLRGRHVHRSDVLVTRARTLRIEGAAVQPDADGELQEPVTSRTWEVDPGAWSVLTPA